MNLVDGDEYYGQERNSLASILNSLEIELDANPITTVNFVRLKSGLTKPCLIVFVGELG